MDYAAIAAALAGEGVRVSADAVQRAEWRARVQLDDHVFARTVLAESTESQSAATRYMAYVLEGSA